jgi:hypothetical protein
VALIDKLLSPVALRMLGCLCEQVTLLGHYTPAFRCCIMPGGETGMPAALTEDVCRCGFGWVRVAGYTPAEDFGEAGHVSVKCRPKQWRLALEIGIAGCMPIGTASALPTCDEYLAAFDRQMAEAAAMRRAVECCFPDPTRGRLVEFGEYVPESEGNCLWATMTATVQVINCDECAEDYVEPDV